MYLESLSKQSFVHYTFLLYELKTIPYYVDVFITINIM